MSLRQRFSKSRRWGAVAELKGVRTIYDHRHKKKPTLSKVFSALPLRLRHLASWRYDHKIVGGDHKPIQMAGTRAGVRPSSNLSLKKKLAFIARRLK